MKVSKKIFIIFSMILLLIPDISLGKDISVELQYMILGKSNKGQNEKKS